MAYCYACGGHVCLINKHYLFIYLFIIIFLGFLEKQKQTQPDKTSL